MKRGREVWRVEEPSVRMGQVGGLSTPTMVVDISDPLLASRNCTAESVTRITQPRFR